MADINISGDITASSALIDGLQVIRSIENKTYGIKLSNGIIINWGTVSPASGGTSVTFAIPFTTTYYSAGGSARISNNNALSLAVNSYGTTSMKCIGQWGYNNSGHTAGDVPFDWVAIGE